MRFKTNIERPNMHRINPRTAGFARIELFFFITMFVLFAWMVLPLFSQTKRVPIKEAVTQMSIFTSALDAFHQQNGDYPAGTNGLDDLVVHPQGRINWHQCLDSIPLDPWGHPYIYAFPGKHNLNSYDLISMGPDGRAGTEDDIVNWQLWHGK